MKPTKVTKQANPVAGLHRRQCYKCGGEAEVFDLRASVSSDADPKILDDIEEALKQGTPYRCKDCKTPWIVLSGPNREAAAAELMRRGSRPATTEDGIHPDNAPEQAPVGPPWPNRKARRRQEALARKGARGA